ncbi:hypothetical protein ABK040_013609 [Willaertia magna]
MSTEITDIQLQNNNLQTLQKLFIGSEFNFNGNSLQNFTNLTNLTIGDYDNNTENDNYQYYINFENLKYLNNLKELTLNLCGLQFFYENLKTLQKLNIYECHCLDDESFQNLINLKYLNIFDCKNINGSCLQYFKESLQNLSTNIPLLDIHFKNCNNLQNFSLTNYSNLEGKFINYLNKIKFIYFMKYNGELIFNAKESSIKEFNKENIYCKLIGSSKKELLKKICLYDFWED